MLSEVMSELIMFMGNAWREVFSVLRMGRLTDAST